MSLIQEVSLQWVRFEGTCNCGRQHVLVGEGVSLRREGNYCVGTSLWEKAHPSCKRRVIEEGGMLL